MQWNNTSQIALVGVLLLPGVVVAVFVFPHWLPVWLLVPPILTVLLLSKLPPQYDRYIIAVVLGLGILLCAIGQITPFAFAPQARLLPEIVTIIASVLLVWLIITTYRRLQQRWNEQDLQFTQLQSDFRRQQILSELASDYQFMARLDSEDQFTVEWLHRSVHRTVWLPTLTHDHIRGMLQDEADLAAISRMTPNETVKDFVFEQQLTDSSGRVAWVRCSLSPFWETAEQHLHVCGTLQDITWEKYAQRQQTESEMRYRRLLNMLPDAVVVHIGGRIAYGNPAFFRLLGIENEQEVLGQSLFRFVHQRWHTAKQQILHQVVQADQITALLELQIVRIDGQICDVETVGVAMNYDGRQAILCVLRDITARKQAEAAIQHAKDIQLSLERRLAEGQRMESLGYLAGGIAHDFNNFLTAIQANIELAQIDLSPQSPPYLLLIQAGKSVRLATSLTRQLLAYAGKGSVILEEIDLNLLVRECILVLTPSLSSDLTFEPQLDGDLPIISADSIQLHQLVMNLVVNAAEAIGEQPGTITLTTSHRNLTAEEFTHMRISSSANQSGEFVILSITDTGSGFDADVLNRIFDPFFSTKRAGRGLGLATVLGVVRSHKAALDVQSTLGQGTTFRIFFPVERM